jgi:hypothetical protein
MPQRLRYIFQITQKAVGPFHKSIRRYALTDLPARKNIRAGRHWFTPVFRAAKIRLLAFFRDFFFRLFEL